MSEETRGYIYRVLTVLGVAAIFYGVLSQEEVAIWLAVIAVALQTTGNALASRNTSGVLGK
jgi:hypothetical protein